MTKYIDENIFTITHRLNGRICHSRASNCYLYSQYSYKANRIYEYAANNMIKNQRNVILIRQKWCNWYKLKVQNNACEIKGTVLLFLVIISICVTFVQFENELIISSNTSQWYVIIFPRWYFCYSMLVNGALGCHHIITSRHIWCRMGH